MRETIKFCIFFLLISFCTVEVFAIPAEINIVAVEHEGYIDADGRGLCCDIFKKIYEVFGIKVNFHLVSFARAKEAVLKGTADILAGAYRFEVEGGLYPRMYFDYRPIAALFWKKQEGNLWRKEASLKGVLGWVRGADYNKYLAAQYDYREYKNLHECLMNLSAERINFVLGNYNEIKNLFEERTVFRNDFRFEVLMNLYIFPVFNKLKGVELSEMYDRRMKEINKTGELKAIFLQNGKDWPY